MRSLAAAGRRLLALSPALDRPLLPLRLARARENGSFAGVDELEPVVRADRFGLNFPAGDAAWNGIGQARDGTVYCVAGTHSLDTGARLFALAPGASSIAAVADLDDVLPRPPTPAIPQGKVHVELSPYGEELIGATHTGFYRARENQPAPGRARGYAGYPGGWFFSVKDRSVVALAQAPEGEGIIAMSLDRPRQRVFALSWPSGLLLGLDLRTREVQIHGAAHGAGEAGSVRGGSWTPICRSIGIDGVTGAAFWSDDAGNILRFAGGRIERVASLPRAEMWRKVAWHSERRAFYGILSCSALIFRFDPLSQACEELGSGRAPGSDAAFQSTLAFSLDASTDRIHLLAPGPGVLRKDEVQLPASTLYLTYDLESSQSHLLGTVRSREGRWVTRAESLVTTGDAAYSICWIEVPRRDRSASAQAVRRSRRGSFQYRFRGYAEELALIRLPLAR